MDVAARAPRFNLRFTIRGAILLMAAVAVGAAAFRDASQIWMTICTSVALVSIFFAVIVAMYGHCDRKAFWTGFAICAAAYFLFAVRFKDSDIITYLATTKVIDFITDKSHPYLTPENSGTSNPRSTYLSSQGSHSTTTLSPRVKLAMSAIYSMTFLQQVICYMNMRVGDDVANGIIIEHQTAIIGHCQCSLVVGFLGGLLAQGLTVRKLRTSGVTTASSKPSEKGGAFDGAT